MFSLQNLSERERRRCTGFRCSYVEDRARLSVIVASHGERQKLPEGSVTRFRNGANVR